MKAKLGRTTKRDTLLAIQDVDKALAGKPSSYSRISPATLRAVKDPKLSIRVSSQFMEFVEAELAKLAVDSARDRQDFYRGAIVAAIANVKRSKSPAWQRFMAAIQPQARKFLGLELDLEGAKEMIEAGAL